MARIVCPAIVALGLVLLGPAAPAQTGNGPSLADRAERARALVESGRFGDALPLYEEMVGETDHPLPRLYLAWCLVELDTRHREAAALLACVAGDGRLGPALDRVASLRSRLAEQSRPGTIVVDIEGDGAARAVVILNGATVGHAPYRALAEPGRHVVRVDGPGCEGRPDVVDLAPGAVVPLRFRCAADPGGAPVVLASVGAGAALALSAPPEGSEAAPSLAAPAEPEPGPAAASEPARGPDPGRTSGSTPAALVAADEAPVSTAKAWTALGAGVALTGVGAWFLVDHGIDRADGSAGSQDAIVGGLATAAGVGLVVTSFFLWPDDPADGERAAGPVAAPVPGGAVLGWAGGF